MLKKARTSDQKSTGIEAHLEKKQVDSKSLRCKVVRNTTTYFVRKISGSINDRNQAYPLYYSIFKR